LALACITDFQKWVQALATNSWWWTSYTMPKSVLAVLAFHITGFPVPSITFTAGPVGRPVL
jgi:hypothetical protein